MNDIFSACETFSRQAKSMRLKTFLAAIDTSEQENTILAGTVNFARPLIARDTT